MMSTFLPSNILWPSANTMLSSKANASCLSWQNEPACITMRVNGKQKEPTKVPSFVFVWMIKSACFDAFCQPTNSRKHLDIPTIGQWEGTFPSEAVTRNKLSVHNNFYTTWFYFDEENDRQFSLTPPYQKLNFFWKCFYFLPQLRLADLDVYLYV